MGKRHIFAQAMLFAACALIMPPSLGAAPADDASTSHGTALTLPCMLWPTPDPAPNRKIWWNPELVRECGGNMVCVRYKQLPAEGREAYSGILIPPRQLAEVLEGCRPELERSHAAGIKVVGISNTILFHPKVFEREGIDPAGLYGLDAVGQPVMCKSWEPQGAWASCLNNPRWLELQTQSVLATARAGFDALQFDLHPYAVEPGLNCHCPDCVTAWRANAMKNYGREIPLPGATGHAFDMNDPVDRVCLAWRYECLARFLDSIQQAVHAQFPGFQIMLNHNAALPDFGAVAAWGALGWPTTELHHLNLGDDSSLYLYRLTEATAGRGLIGLVNMAYQRKPDYRAWVAMAEAYAGGGYFYAPCATPDARSVTGQLYAFMRDHEVFFKDTTSDARVAVIYSWRDQAFKEGGRYVNFTVKGENAGVNFRRVAAVLAHSQVPYDAICLERGFEPSQLVHYPVIVAPQLLLLSDRDANRLRDYVEQGGRLLTVGQLGEEHDADMEFSKRDKPLLQEWCGEQPVDTAWAAPLGRGKIAFTPRTVPGYTESTLTLAPEFMSAADEVGLFRQFSLAGSSLVQAPIEVTIRASGERRMLHLIRLGPPESVPDKSVAFSYELPAGQEVESAQAFSSQPSPEQLQLNWSIKEGRFEGQLNRLENYVVIEVKFKRREK